VYCRYVILVGDVCVLDCVARWVGVFLGLCLVVSSLCYGINLKMTCTLRNILY
jgi:UPF0716 family protein affecting phage T7 exclusion